MRLIKWTLLAAIGCAPAFAFADEPAKKAEKPDQGVKFELRLEFKKDGEAPHVIVLNGDGKDAKDQGKDVKELTKSLQLLLEGKNAKKAEPRRILIEEATLNRDDAPGRFKLQLHHEHKKGTFLGISTSAPPPVLSKHLGLNNGFGLVIDFVAHDSPAAKAGLQVFDVLQKVDDQLVVNYEQLTVLIRSRKPGEEVKLAVIHEGKPAVITAKLIEHEIEAMGDADGNYEIEGVIKSLLPRVGNATWQIAPGQNFNLWQPAPGQPGGALVPGPFYRAQVFGGGTIGQPHANSKTLVEGDRICTLIMSPWGQKVLVVVENGKQVFAGDVNTKEQREKVPAKVTETLEKLEKEIVSGSKPVLDVVVPKPNPNPANLKKTDNGDK